MTILSSALKIANVSVRNRVFLAPMSGVTDLPFRRLAWQAGAGLVMSEMVASAELCYGRLESQLRMNGDGLDLKVVQLAGRDPARLRQAAIIVEESGADIIDLNMGCPAKKVVGGYAGAALMRDIPLAIKLIEATVSAVKIPVTLKIRLGWDGDHINAPQLAKCAQQAGVSLVTVHGRTREQFYSGQANWDAIKRVREVIDIPLVANGDIATKNDAEDVMQRCGADAVMIGRACYGAPWLAGKIAGHDHAIDIAEYAMNHYTAMIEYYGAKAGIRHARKHLDWYLTKHAKGCFSQEERRALLTETDSQKVYDGVGEIFARTQQKVISAVA